MKKILALALALALCATLAACGGKETEAPTPADPAPVESAPAPAPAASEPEAPSDGPTDEQVAALTEAYNQVVDAYNEAADMAEENGWTADEEAMADLDKVAEVMGPIGDALNAGDLSSLEGEDFDALTSKLLDYVSQSQTMTEKFSVPCENGEESGSEAAASGEAVIADETLKPLAEAYNKLAPAFQELYVTAEANGWMEDETTAAELQGLTAVLGFIGSGLTEDPSLLDGTDFDELIGKLETEIAPTIDTLAERVSVPFGG